MTIEQRREAEEWLRGWTGVKGCYGHCRSHLPNSDWTCAWCSFWALLESMTVDVRHIAETAWHAGYGRAKGALGPIELPSQSDAACKQHVDLILQQSRETTAPRSTNAETQS